MEGQSVLKHSIGSYQMCFRGNVDTVKILALNVIKKDLEKEKPEIQIDYYSDSLIISYVDTKCLDDSLDATPDSCRAVWTASRCK